MRIARPLVRPFALASALAFVAGCGASDADDHIAADVHGDYSGELANQQNSCPVDFKPGNQTPVTCTIEQSGATAQIDVTGDTGLFLALVVGTSTFSGTVDGSHFGASLLGTKTQTTGECTYTWRADFAGDISGDTMTGVITYSPQTGGQAACASAKLEGCSFTQSFKGTRPADGG